jgi:hypothetical protein
MPAPMVDVYSRSYEEATLNVGRALNSTPTIRILSIKVLLNTVRIIQYIFQQLEHDTPP